MVYLVEMKNVGMKCIGELSEIDTTQLSVP